MPGRELMGYFNLTVVRLVYEACGLSFESVLLAELESWAINAGIMSLYNGTPND